MAEHYNANNIIVSDEAITINGEARHTGDFLRAEAYQVEDWIRNAVIFTVGCLAPILTMIVATQTLLVPQYLDDGHNYWFGAIVLVAVVILGAAAAAIGKAWPKPWGVVVERPEFGFGKLLTAKTKDEAEQIADAINQVVCPDAVAKA